MFNGSVSLASKNRILMLTHLSGKSEREFGL